MGKPIIYVDLYFAVCICFSYLCLSRRHYEWQKMECLLECVSKTSHSHSVQISLIFHRSSLCAKFSSQNGWKSVVNIIRLNSFLRMLINMSCQLLPRFHLVGNIESETSCWFYRTSFQRCLVNLACLQGEMSFDFITKSHLFQLQ